MGAPMNTQRRADVEAVIALLAERWPETFSLYEKRRRPLKIGIRGDVIAALAGALTEDEVRHALRFYCGNEFYLRACLCGAWRVGLDGKPAGTVTREGNWSVLGGFGFGRAAIYGHGRLALHRGLRPCASEFH